MSFASADQSSPDTGTTSSDRPAAGKSTRSGALQLKATGGGSGRTFDTANAGFTGEPMALPYRAEMESAFGMGFGDVLAYGDESAGAANAAMGSRAYAVGNQIAFDTATPAKEVVAHELAHTIQQGGTAASEPAVQPWSLGVTADPFEAEADAAAASVLAGEPVAVGLRGPRGIQTWGGEDHYAIGNLAGQKATRGLPSRPSPNIRSEESRAGTFSSGDVTSAPLDSGERTSTRAIGVPSAARDASGHPTAGVDVTTGGAGSRATMVRTDEGEVSFGALTRAGGDYTRGPDGLRAMSRENDLVNNWDNLGAINLPPGNDFGLLADIGTTNANHFYPLNRNEYRNHHAKALVAARAGDDRTAMMEEGFASHFLMDTFSAGHMAPRSLDSIGALRDPTVLDHALTADAMRQGVGRAAQAGGATMARGIYNGATSAVTDRFNRAVADGSASGESTGGAIANWIGETLGQEVTVGGYDINPINGAVVAEYTGVVTRAVGRGIGSLGGGVSGVVAAPGAAYDGAVAAANDRNLQSQAFDDGMTAAMGPELYADARNGMLRTKDWHDFFCALPDGLPTDKGRFHGDHLMDGHDLDHVSNVCAGSLREVLAALPNTDGTPGPGFSYDAAAQMPTPAFSQIMADPVAGPAWRLMMNEYRADMARGLNEVQAGDHSRTDGGTDYDSREVVDLIYQNVFGGSLDAPEIRTGTVATERANVYQSLINIQHFLEASWGANASLSMNDDLNRPMNPDNPGWNSAAPADRGGYGAGVMRDGSRLTRFNPWLMENRYGMFSGLVASATRWVEACTNAEANHDVIVGRDELATAQSTLARATSLLAQVRALPRLGDSVSLVDGASGPGSMINREMAGLALEHGLADMVSTQWVDGPGREFRAAAGPVVTAMIGALRQLDPAAAVPTVTPTAAAAAAADPHL